MPRRMQFYDPLTGRAISEATFFSRVARYQAEREIAADRLDHSIFRYETAPSERSAKYWDRRFRQDRATLDAFDFALEDMERQLEAQEPEPIQIPEDVSDEWEFGTDYKASQRGGHDVSVNVRLMFEQPVNERHARRTMTDIVRGGYPDDVTIKAVDWRGSSRTAKWKSGGEQHLEQFLPVLYVGGVQYLRAGAVKPDEL